MIIKISSETPARFISCGTCKNYQRHVTRMLTDFQLVIGLSGTALIGQGSQKYEIKKGEMALFRPNEMQFGYADMDEHTSFFWVHFDFDTPLEKMSDEEFLRIFSIFQNNKYYSEKNPFFLLPDYFSFSNPEKITPILNQLRTNSEQVCYSESLQNFVVSALLAEISQQLLFPSEKAVGSLEHVRRAGEDAAAVRLGTILQWIRENALKNISLHHVASEFCYNKEYLSRFFKEKMGMSVGEYISHVKIETAKNLLCMGNMNVSLISESVGYHDPKYFMRVFKSLTGMTPKEYRNWYFNVHIFKANPL